MTINGDQTVTASFSFPILTVAAAGTGSGTITSSPAGINCGVNCSTSYTPGMAVTLTATPSSGSVFTAWSGGGCTGTAGCTVTMDAAKTVTASFAAPPTVAPVITSAVAGNAQVTLNWTAVPDATSYNVYRGTTAGGESTTPLTTTDTSIAITGLTNGTTYFFKIAAVNAAGNGTLSNEASATPSATALAQAVIYQNDFSVAAGSEWSDPTRATSNGEWFLGTSACGFGPGSDTLSLNNLPSHTEVRVDFDLYIIGSMDGVGYDNWQLTADGNNLLLTSFANYSAGQIQDYPNQLPPYGTGGRFPWRTGAFEIGHVTGSDSGWGDSTYRLSYTFSHVASTLGLQFTGMQNESACNEGWGLDNVRVTVFNPTAPPTAPTLNAVFSPTLVTLKWNTVDAALSYNIYQGNTSDGELSTPIKTGVTSTSAIITGLRRGTDYFFKIAAVLP
ncbi:hypothetical protein CCP3SC15_3040001 [Gammaproteobacteria bacterium]